MDRGQSHQQVLARLRELIAKGKSLRQCSHELRMPRSTLHERLGAGEARKLRGGRRIKHENLSPEERRTLQRHLKRAKDTLTKIAAIVGCHKSTVSRRASKQLEADPGLEFRTRRTRVEKRCPIHGKLRTWPCVACAALGARKPQP